MQPQSASLSKDDNMRLSQLRLDGTKLLLLWLSPVSLLFPLPHDTQAQNFVTGRCDLQYQDSPDSSPTLKDQSTYIPRPSSPPTMTDNLPIPQHVPAIFHSMSTRSCLSQPATDELLHLSE